MRAVARLLHRDHQCVTQFKGEDQVKTLETVRLGLLWRAYIALLQGLCQLYRVAPPRDPPADDVSLIKALQDFNPDLADVRLIVDSREQVGHWLFQLRQAWWLHWQPDSVLKEGDHAKVKLIAAVSDSAAQETSWLDDAHNGLATWSEDFARHHQTN